MVKKLIYFATQMEAQASLVQLDAKLLPTGEYSFSQGIILIGGVGILQTMHAVSQHIHKVDEVWNLGVAGALHTRYKLGDCVQITEVVRNALFPPNLEDRSQRFHNTLFPRIVLSQQPVGARLVTSDYPIHQQHLTQQLAAHADLVDMEGYGIAYLAQQWQKPCHMWKVISDFASPGGAELIKMQLNSASVQLADIAHNACAINQAGTRVLI